MDPRTRGRHAWPHRQRVRRAFNGCSWCSIHNLCLGRVLAHDVVYCAGASSESAHQQHAPVMVCPTLFPEMAACQENTVAPSLEAPQPSLLITLPGSSAKKCPPSAPEVTPTAYVHPYRLQAAVKGLRTAPVQVPEPSLWSRSARKRIDCTNTLMWALKVTSYVVFTQFDSAW